MLFPSMNLKEQLGCSCFLGFIMYYAVDCHGILSSFAHNIKKKQMIEEGTELFAIFTTY